MGSADARRGFDDHRRGRDAAGKGAIAIVRASGPSVPELARRLVRTKSRLRRRVATYATIVDESGDLLDHGLAIFFQAPHSYTGEEMLELQIHGSPVVAREVVRAMLACGAALAEPGEFTRRAFFNGKMGLHAAAAVADLIDAQTRSAARAALANFDSGLANEVRAVRSALATILRRARGYDRLSGRGSRTRPWRSQGKAGADSRAFRAPSPRRRARENRA